jgi:hypothetical protein
MSEKITTPYSIHQDLREGGRPKGTTLKWYWHDRDGMNHTMLKTGSDHPCANPTSGG